jgi:hypothetical protein
MHPIEDINISILEVCKGLLYVNKRILLLCENQNHIIGNTKHPDYIIHLREYRRGNQKWRIQRNWQHRGHTTE